jgi:hypothetical protein
MLTVAVVLLRGSPGPRAVAGDECAPSESSITTDSLHDLRSFSDAMAIVRGVREAIPPAPKGPEGWAGMIGRRVTVRVERVLWRRPHAPEPPRRFSFTDLGWTGTLEHRRPLVVCGETRMVLGRRYLAPVVRYRGTWFPFFATRLRLRGDLVVGGVDGGEAENSHEVLVGRSVRGAVRLVAHTLPYRAVVLHPEGSPRRRLEAVYRDDYTIWGDPKGLPVIVDSGVTSKSRWQLYLRLPARGGMCVGMSVRALWRPVPAPSGEGCGPRTLRAGSLRPAVFMARHRGAFAFGRTGRVPGVRVRFDDGDWQEFETLPTPIPPGGRDRFWVVPLDAACSNFTVQALDLRGNITDESYAACPSG